jgi:hypothetical protein
MLLRVQSILILFLTKKILYQLKTLICVAQ